MRGYRALIVLWILIVILALSGCRLKGLLDDDVDEGVSNVSYLTDERQEEFIDETDQKLRKTILYYRDEKGLLIPVMRRIPWEEGIAKSSIIQLVDKPVLREELSKVGLLPVLPGGTDVIGLSINEGLCKIDFNENILDYNDKIDEKAIVQSIVYTLTEFDTIDRVQIIIEGETIKKLPYGSKVNKPLARKNINLSDTIAEDSVSVVTYYNTSMNGEEVFVVPVTKPVSSIRADVKSALLALLEGAPGNTGLYSELPMGTRVNDVYVKDGIAYIDFSKDIEELPDKTKYQQSLVYELGLTLREIEPSISSIRILADGTEVKLHNDVSMILPDYPNEL